MSYTALYRKFRPAAFEDVKGQEHIVTTLKNQIRADRIGHAYLFCGTRGTGKTTIAKILAKAVNCEHPIDGSPCNACAMCKVINAQTSMNVIEIDAASNNGVDNIREIIDEVQYSPTEGRYKVYIIDEVHMLSTGAFNALLKTLEEPPAYVIFILATTEVHKIPITILSRCQRYDFKRITIDTIAARILELADKEGIQAEEKAIRYVAKAADGSMRDGLSLFDQCIAFYLGQELTYDRVLEVLGAVDTEVFGTMFRHIARGEAVEALELLEKLIIDGRELGQFTTDFTWYLRNLLLIKTSDMAMDMIDVSSEQQDILRQEALLCDADTLMRYIRVLSELSNQLKFASQKRVLAEIALIKLCRPEMEKSYDSVLDRIRQIERKLEDGSFIPTGAINGTNGLKKVEEGQGTATSPVLSDEAREALAKAVPEDLKAVGRDWGAIMAQLPPAVKSMMGSARPIAGEGNVLILQFTDELEKNFIDTPEHLLDIEETIRKRIQKEIKVETRYAGSEDTTATAELDLRNIVGALEKKGVSVEYED
ncbi:MAG: DNA polymerase III subunit gamma/tau [Acetivibrio ethanolgignens]